MPITTRSGRVSQSAPRFQDMMFALGSGTGPNIDRYDRTYFGQEETWDFHVTLSPLTQEDTDFIVNDDDYDEKDDDLGEEYQDENEEEEEFDDEDSEDEEDEDDDEEEDNSDDDEEDDDIETVDLEDADDFTDYSDEEEEDADDEQEEGDLSEELIMRLAALNRVEYDSEQDEDELLEFGYASQ